MAKKRAKVNIDYSQSADLFVRTAPDANKERERRRQRDRLVKRATYDITPELKEAVARRATDLGLPASQFAMFLLCDALRRYDAGEIDPTPFLGHSDSPRFRKNLLFGEWYHLKGDIG